MPHHQLTLNYLKSIDDELVQYNTLLVTKGFSNTKLLAHLTYQDVSELPVGHRKLLINEVSKIRSPHSKGLLAALDIDTMHNNSTPRKHTIFEPKELFPLTSKHIQDNPKIDSYTYMTPMDKHLTRIQDDIKSKEVEIQKCDIEEMSQCLASDDDLDSRATCSFYHCKGHRKNHCSSNKCITSMSCGKMRLHKNGMKHLDSMKAQLHKLLKEKQSLDSESEKIQQSIVAHTKSFPQAVCSYLINSNKQKYLTMYGDEDVPLTKVINLDISVLQKHYNNCIPDDLVRESEMFESIIQMNDTKIWCATNSLEMKLKQSVTEIDKCIKKTSVDNNTQSLTPVSSCPATPTMHENHLTCLAPTDVKHLPNDYLGTNPSNVTQNFLQQQPVIHSPQYNNIFRSDYSEYNSLGKGTLLTIVTCLLKKITQNLPLPQYVINIHVSRQK